MTYVYTEYTSREHPNLLHFNFFTVGNMSVA